MSTHTRNRGLVWLTATAAALSLAMAIAGFEFGPVAHGVTRGRLCRGIIPSDPAAARWLG